MPLTVEQVIAAFAEAKPSLTADYNIVAVHGANLRVAHLAVSRRGLASLLVPLPHIEGDSTRLTRAIAVSAAMHVEFVQGDDRQRLPAAVVECRDSQLLRTFAALVAAVVARLEDGPPPSWASISRLLSEWERLLGRRQLLSGESEVGLWGELWCIARSARAPTMLEAWRGPEAERVDFLLDNIGVEVKAGSRQGIHAVAQSQVEESLGAVPVVLMSMWVMVEPLHGRSLPEIVREVTGQVDSVATFEEKLANVGYSRDDEAAYHQRYVLLGPPLLYHREDVPRVRSADAGVSNLRYRVELPREAAMTGDAQSEIIEVLGLSEAFAREYPCA